MNDKETFVYDENTGRTKCYLRYEDKDFIGEARCHPDDMEFATEFVGCEIARMRATTKVLKYIVKEDRIAIKALKDFYNNIAESKSMKQNDWLRQKFLNEIDSYEEDIKDIKMAIETIKVKLTAYTTGKDSLYKSLRKVRERRSDKINKSI